MALLHPLVLLTRETFLADSHAARYGDVVRDQPEAFDRLLAILNNPEHQAQMVAAEATHHRSALSGVVREIEADDRIAAVLETTRGPRFRQTVGVAVRLTMEALGWSTTGRKGPVSGATTFKTAERYAPPTATPQTRALAALDAVATIGDDAERARTGAELLQALVEARSSEGRAL